VNVPTWGPFFDLNGTLLDPRPRRKRAGRPPGEVIIIETLPDAVAQGMVDTLSGEHRPFIEYLENALQRPLQIHHIDLGPGRIDRVTSAMTVSPNRRDPRFRWRTRSEARSDPVISTGSGGRTADEHPSYGVMTNWRVAEICRSERYLSVDRTSAQPGFAPLSWSRLAADGWVRTHANSSWHPRALRP
jgi:hypothetical protein